MFYHMRHHLSVDGEHFIRLRGENPAGLVGMENILCVLKLPGL